MAEPLHITHAQAVEIFGSDRAVAPEVIEHYGGTSSHNVDFQFSASTLGLEHIAGEGDQQLVRVTGNTVARLCPAAEHCGPTVCGLAVESLYNYERRERDCAAANTQAVFGDRRGYVLSPTLPGGQFTNEVVFMGDPLSSTSIEVNNEYGRATPMFEKISPGAAFVISEADLWDPAEGLVIEVNNADSNWALATFSLFGERFAVAAFFSRTNLGSRPKEDQILRKAIEGVLERRQVNPVYTQDILHELTVDVHVGYSATRKNFAHPVRVPPADSTYGNYLLRLSGLIDLDGTPTGEITPTMVMDDQYPAALENGEIYGEYEAENDIDVPRGPGGCPGHGEKCHIDYRKITRRTVFTQLQQMGVRPENINFVDEHAIDPADQGNYLASNRRAQLGGVSVNQTPRSANAVHIAFPSRRKIPPKQTRPAPRARHFVV